MKTISMDEYKSLKRNSILLEELHNAGVDNWHGYSDAFQEYDKRLQEEGLEG